MSKISRNQLKALVKECLVEVLIEGLDSKTGNLSLRESKQKKALRKPQKKIAKNTVDNIKFNDKINQSVSACTADPVLGNILADTARTTLQEQIGEESKVTSHSRQVSINGDQAAKAASTADPLDLFGESASNWASLAFSESKQTK